MFSKQVVENFRAYINKPQMRRYLMGIECQRYPNSIRYIDADVHELAKEWETGYALRVALEDLWQAIQREMLRLWRKVTK